MSTAAAAQLLSVTLYYRRFFPYYSFCLIAGLDEEGVCGQGMMRYDTCRTLPSLTLPASSVPTRMVIMLLCTLPAVGKGAVYGYDAVGSFKRDEYGAMGSGQNFIMPILDNLVSLLS